MGLEIKKLIAIILAFLVLEIPVFYLCYRIAEREVVADSQQPIPAETMMQTAPTEQTAPAESIPQETIPAETIPAETIPEVTKPPRITIDEVPQYYQNDYPDEPYGTDTVAQSGSNMAALAMVATYLTDHSYYPDQMADMLAHFLGGHYQRLEYGSDLLQLSWTRAENVHASLQAVKDGKIVILLMNGNSMFTWRDHFVVVTGQKENGNYTVLDPDQTHYDKLQKYFTEGFSDKDLTRGYSCGWIYDKADMPEEPFVYTPEPPAAESRYPGLELTQEEKNLLAKLICMEAASEPFEGQQAVAEVVLNRLASGRFQNSIHNIIHADGQFPSVPYLYKAKPDYSQYKAIEQAQYGPYVLPDDVVFYAKFKVNDNYWGQIGSHYFCYSY